MSAQIAFFSTVALLTISNVFMTFAWYGHLKYQHHAMFVFILVSWGIAFFEYCFQVPANRIGHQYFSAVELKAMQEVITMLVFIMFSIFFLGESIRWNHCFGLALIVIGATVVFYK